MKKRVLEISIIIFMVAFIFINIFSINTYATNDTYTLKLEILDNKKAEDVDIYLLLPTEYIEYVIQKDGLDIAYEGPQTLKQNEIPDLRVNTANVKDDTYKENEIEYVQILLDKTENDVYEFDILSDYTKMDMKYRIKNLNKDYIMHIDNFRIKSGICEIQYDYANDTIKQPDEKVIPFATKALIVLLVIIVVTGLIAYIKHRR